MEAGEIGKGMVVGCMRAIPNLWGELGCRSANGGSDGNGKGQ